jgi:hypothetical protein
MRLSVASAVGDYGGAEAVVPALVALANRGALGSVVAAPTAWTVLERAGIAFSPYAATDVAAAVASCFEGEPPSLVLTTTSWGDDRLEPSILEAARSREIPTVSVIDFWSNYRQRFETAGGLLLPTWIALPDESARAAAVAEGLPEDRLVVTGNPHYETLVQRYQHFDREERLAFRERVGVPRQATLTLFVSQPIRALYGRSLGYDEAETLVLVRDAMEQVADWIGHPVTLAVRAHPRDPGASVPGSTGKVSVRPAVGDDGLAWALAADLVVGMTSALLLQAALLGSRVVSVQPNLRGADPLPSNRLGLSDAVYQPEEVASVLYRALARPAHGQPNRSAQRIKTAVNGATLRLLDLVVAAANQSSAAA